MKYPLVSSNIAWKILRKWMISGPKEIVSVDRKLYGKSQFLYNFLWPSSKANWEITGGYPHFRKLLFYITVSIHFIFYKNYIKLHKWSVSSHQSLGISLGSSPQPTTEPQNFVEVWPGNCQTHHIWLVVYLPL